MDAAQAPAAEPAREPAPEPAPEPEPAAEPEPAPEPEPAAEPEPAPEPEPADHPEDEPAVARAARDRDVATPHADRDARRQARKERRAARRAARDRRRREAAQPPGWGFTKGALVGALVVIPAVALALVALSGAGLGRPGLAFAHAAVFTAMFAGAPAVLTAGGIGRLAARAAIAHTHKSPGAPGAGPGLAGSRGRRRAVVSATRAMALAGAGLIVVAAIPLGSVPRDAIDWSWLGAAGAAAGAIPGAVLGVWAAGVWPR